MTIPNRESVEQAVVVMIALREAIGHDVTKMLSWLDEIDGDPDLEDSEASNPLVDERGRIDGDFPSQDENCEMSGDEEDTAYSEWHTRRRRDQRAVYEQCDRTGMEDDEDGDQDSSVEDGRKGFDPEEDFCTAGDDRVCSGSVIPGTYSRPDNGAGDADDAEREAMTHDVPTLPAYSLDLDPSTGQRAYVGHENLLTSFRTNGNVRRSATSGKRFVSRGHADKPGAPV